MADIPRLFQKKNSSTADHAHAQLVSGSLMVHTLSFNIIHIWYNVESPGVKSDINEFDWSERDKFDANCKRNIISHETTHYNILFSLNLKSQSLLNLLIIRIVVKKMWACFGKLGNAGANAVGQLLGRDVSGSHWRFSSLISATESTSSHPIGTRTVQYQTLVTPLQTVTSLQFAMTLVTLSWSLLPMTLVTMLQTSMWR